MIGSAGNLDCQGNNGCGVQATGTEYSYGTGFNSVGGGWYAMERTSKFIKVWFWPRYVSVRDDVRYATASVNTDKWVSICVALTLARSDMGAKRVSLSRTSLTPNATSTNTLHRTVSLLT